MINADKPHLWKADVAASVDMYNAWFLNFAPEAYRNSRAKTVPEVEAAMIHTADLTRLTPNELVKEPGILPVLRTATAPPIARDRLMGLAGVTRNLIQTMEEQRRLPPKMEAAERDAQLTRVCNVVDRLLDRDLFPWLAGVRPATDAERTRAATIVADRLCGVVADPIVRNAQEARQLALIESYLTAHGYRRVPASSIPSDMVPGTFAFRMNVRVGAVTSVNIPVDAVIQPALARPGDFPILVEAKSAGDFTNTNKRRKEEAIKVHQLRETFGSGVQLVLFLCGYFDTGYLGYEAAEGLDWVWEHRVSDLDQLGI